MQTTLGREAPTSKAGGCVPHPHANNAPGIFCSNAYGGSETGWFQMTEEGELDRWDEEEGEKRRRVDEM
ncbi:hypothetical protein BO85DRAFT_341841, partial [Aspergillus piperis CBS 112811]